MSEERVTGLQKAAMLLIALGPDAAAEVLRRLPEDQVERVTAALVRTQQVSTETMASAILEGYRMARSSGVMRAGGPTFARAVLSDAIGQSKADEIMGRVETTVQPAPFDFVREMDPSQLVTFIQNEHPQVIALLLSHLPPHEAASLLSALEGELQVDVAHRIATMERTDPEVVEQIDRVLRKKLSLVLSRGYSSAGGVQFLVKILNNVDRGSEKIILENLDIDNPELAAEIRKMMFVFEDIAQLDDQSLQRVLKEVDSKDLALALRGASEQLRSRIFKNLSSRAAAMLQDDMTAAGPVRTRLVEEAQYRIVATVRRLDDAEEIIITRGDEHVV